MDFTAPIFRNARNTRLAASAGPDRHHVIAGYRIGEEIGRDPLGKIYRAQHLTTGQRVVFRGFTRPEGTDAARWEAAKAQFRDLLTLHLRLAPHPNIQAIVAFDGEGDLFWVASEYFEGQTLQSLLAAQEPRPLAWVIAVLQQVGAAVDWAGERGLCHTDLTPYNILLVDDPSAPEGVRVKVINFGLAHARSKYGSRFAAPEQMTGAEGDRQADVYAVGALLHELLSGQALFTGATPDLVAQKVQYAQPFPPTGQPAFVRDVLATMLHKDPRGRYASVGEAIEDLRHRRSPAGVVARAGRSESTATGEAERFTRLEIDGAPPLRPDTRVALQGYRLSEQDLLVARERLQALRASRLADYHAGRIRSFRHAATVTAVLAGLAAIALGIHAAKLPQTYRQVTLTGVTGTPAVIENGVRRTLHVGDVLRAATARSGVPT